MLPNQFQEIQHLGNTIAGYHAWPCYDKIREELEECHPRFIVSPNGDDAIVFLQDLFENTVNGTLLDELVAENITAKSLEYYGKHRKPKKWVCIGKLGLDSSSLQRLFSRIRSPQCESLKPPKVRGGWLARQSGTFVLVLSYKTFVI